ncbi:hypothetical protein F5880DRAFT_1224240 [Lentinula raphanica]|nr:hypothetical protein F5880DRAFT_1224240 [Lentinula raphanica]
MALHLDSSVLRLESNYFSTSAVVVALLAYHNPNIKRYSHDVASTILKTLGRNFSSIFLTTSPRLSLGSVRYRARDIGLCLGHLVNSFLFFRAVFRSLFARLEHLLVPWWSQKPSPYSTYPTPEAEQRYWHSAKIYRRKLQSLDARFSAPCPSSLEAKNAYEERIPVISSYQPALPPLPETRMNTSPGGAGKQEMNVYHLPTKAFCKWHRMTYPDQPLLELLAAARLKEAYTPAEKREIHRISRLIPNKKAYRTNDNLLDHSRYYYRDMWDAWQEKQSLDVEVIFT